MIIKQITWAENVNIQLIGYVRYTVSMWWNTSILKIVARNMILKPHAPTRDTIIGTIEYPKPLSEPTITSMTPHNAYVVHMNDSLIIPCYTTSGLSVEKCNNGFPNMYARLPNTTPTTVTHPNAV